MKKRIFFGVVLIILLGICNYGNSEAAAKYVSSVAWDTPKKIGNAIFVAKRQKVGTEYMSKIVMKKNGKNKVLVSKVNAAFVTNGSVLYYSKHEKKISDYTWDNAIYSYSISSGKSKKVTSGKNYTVSGCSGTYLYCGINNEADGIDLYAFNLKSKKKKHMTDVVGRVVVSNEKVLTTTNTGDSGNYPIYVFNLDGSGKKKIANGGYATIKNGKVYYSRFNEKIGKFKMYCCSLKGKNKKPVTGWLDTIPSKYL